MSGALAELRRRLPKAKPCAEAVAWLEAGDYPTLQAAWTACSRADWMEWLASALGLLTATAWRAYEEATATTCQKIIPVLPPESIVLDGVTP